MKKFVLSLSHKPNMSDFIVHRTTKITQIFCLDIIVHAYLDSLTESLPWQI